MITIHKYRIGIETHQQVPMPEGAQLLSVQKQPVGGVGHVFVLWARVDDAHVQVRRRIVMCGTGHPAPSNAPFIGTLIDGAFVWHFFDGGEAGF
jgi:hypothetical protein